MAYPHISGPAKKHKIPRLQTAPVKAEREKADIKKEPECKIAKWDRVKIKKELFPWKPGPLGYMSKGIGIDSALMDKGKYGEFKTIGV